MTLALTEEIVVGVKVMFTPTVCPPARTTGRLAPVTRNAELRLRILEIVTAVVPVLVKTAIWVFD